MLSRGIGGKAGRRTGPRETSRIRSRRNRKYLAPGRGAGRGRMGPPKAGRAGCNRAGRSRNSPCMSARVAMRSRVCAMPRHSPPPHDRLHLVDRDPEFELRGRRGVVREEPRPRLPGLGGDGSDERMPGEIGNRLGPAASREVGRRRAENPARACDGPGDEVRVGDRAPAHGEVHALLDEVGDALVEAQFDLDARISREEFGQRRQQEVPAEGAGHVDARLPVGCRGRAQGFPGPGQPAKTRRQWPR